MSDLELPHLPPIRFAKEVISQDDTKARVLVAFEDLPSLAMLIEASAQSSAALSDGSSSGGFLAGMKNVKLLSRPTQKVLSIDVIQQHSLGNMSMVDFEVYEEDSLCAKGSLVLALS